MVNENGMQAICQSNEFGLTKRELFAAMAMQGWFAGCGNAYSEFTNPNRPPKVMADACVQAADALLAALDGVAK